MLLYGLTATVFVAVVVTGITVTVHRRRRDLSVRRVLVVALAGALVGLGLSLLGDEPWGVWRAVAMETVVAVFGVVVNVGRQRRERPGRS